MNIIQYRKTPSIRTTPFVQLSELHREMNRLFAGSAFAQPTSGWFPALDITQDQENVEVIVELPGLKKEEISLTLQENVLTITGERKKTEDKSEGQTHRTERHFGTFERSIELPAEVDYQKVKAAYANGLLTVTLPKAETAKPKQIQINVA